MSKIILEYTERFLKTLKKLDKKDQEEVILRVELFENIENHKILKLHKLKGKLKDKYSFSVNYYVRIILVKNKNVWTLLDIGDHDIYDKYI